MVWPKLNKIAKNLILDLIYGPPNFFQKILASSVTRYYSQLSSCIISENIMIQSWENVVTDRGRDGRADGQADESDFIGRCLTKVERTT